MEHPTDNRLKRFKILLSKYLPQKFLSWYGEKLGEIEDKFKSLTGQEQYSILILLGDCWTRYVAHFRSVLPADPTAVEDVFRALHSTYDHRWRNIVFSWTTDDAVLPIESSKVLYEFDSFYHLISNDLPHMFVVLFGKEYDKFKDKFKSLTDRERRQILTSLDGWPSESIRDFNRILDAGPTAVDTVFDALLTLTDGYRCSRDIVLRLSDAVDSVRSSVEDHEFDSFYRGVPKVVPHRFLVSLDKEYDEYKDKFKSLTDRERRQILTLLDGCPSESTRYFYRILNAGPTTVDTIFHALLMVTVESISPPLWGAPDDSYALSIQSHSQRLPPGHDRGVIFPADGKHQATEISPHGASASNSQRPAGFLSDDLVGLQRSDRKLGIEHIKAKLDASACARADATSKYLKLYEIMLPLNCSNAYQTTSILESNFHSAGLPLSTKTSGYITVGLASAAVITSLAGFNLSIFKPETLPFGCSPRRMMKIMHVLALHATAYAFIWTMSHQFLQNDPIIMWIVAVLASALFTSLIIFTAWRN